MALNFKKIIGAVSSVIPGGNLVKTALGLIIPKAAKKLGLSKAQADKLFIEANKLAEYDHEIKTKLIEVKKAEMEHELEFYGRYTDLNPTAKLWRGMIRPVIAASLVGFYLLGLLVAMVQSLFNVVPIYAHPGFVIEGVKWVILFYFCSRGIEKIADIVKK